MTLLEKLEAHFNDAAARHPRHAHTFREEFNIYERALVGRNPICEEILRLKTPNEPSCRPPEVVEVFNQAYKIYAGHKGPRV